METLNRIIPQPQLKVKQDLNTLYRNKEYATYDFDGEGNTERLRSQNSDIPLVHAIKDYSNLYYPAIGELGLSFQYIQKLLNGLQKVKDKYNINVSKPDMTSYIYSSSTFVGQPESVPLTGDKEVNEVWALNTYLGSLYHKPLYTNSGNNSYLTTHNALKFFKYIENQNVTIDNNSTVNQIELINTVTLSIEGTSGVITYTIEENETISYNNNPICFITGWNPQSKYINASLNWYINSNDSQDDDSWISILESSDINNLNSTTEELTPESIENKIGIKIPVNIRIDKEKIYFTPQNIPFEEINSYNGKELFIRVKISDHSIGGKVYDYRQKIYIKVVDTTFNLIPYSDFEQEDYIFNLDSPLAYNNDLFVLNTIEDINNELNKDIPVIRKAIVDCNISGYSKTINLFLYSCKGYPTGGGKQVVYSLNPASYSTNIENVTGVSCLGIIIPKNTDLGDINSPISNLSQIKCDLYVETTCYHQISVSPEDAIIKEDFVFFKIPIDKIIDNNLDNTNIKLYSNNNGSWKGQNRLTSLKLSIIDKNSTIRFERTYGLYLHEIKVKLFERLYLFDYGNEYGEYWDDRLLENEVDEKFKTWYINNYSILQDPYLNQDLSSVNNSLTNTYYSFNNDLCSIVSLTDIFAINKKPEYNNNILLSHILFTKPCLKEDFITNIDLCHIKPYTNEYISFEYNFNSNDIDIKYAYVRTFFNKDSKGLYSGDPYLIELKTNTATPSRQETNIISGLQIGGIKQQILLNQNFNLSSDTIWNYIYPIFIYNDSNYSTTIDIKDYTRTLYDTYDSKTITIEAHELIYLCQNKYVSAIPSSLSKFKLFELSVNNSTYNCLISRLTEAQCVNYRNIYYNENHYPQSLSISNESLIEGYPSIIYNYSYRNYNYGHIYHLQLQEISDDYSMVLVVLEIKKSIVSSILQIDAEITYNTSGNTINDTSNESWLQEVWQPSNMSGLDVVDNNYTYWYIPYFYNKVNDNTNLNINLKNITIQDTSGKWYYYNDTNGTNVTDTFVSYNPDYSGDLISHIDDDGQSKFNKMRNTSNYCMIYITIDELDTSHPQGWGFFNDEFDIHSGLTINGQDLQY